VEVPRIVVPGVDVSPILFAELFHITDSDPKFACASLWMPGGHVTDPGWDLNLTLQKNPRFGLREGLEKFLPFLIEFEGVDAVTLWRCEGDVPCGLSGAVHEGEVGFVISQAINLGHPELDEDLPCFWNLISQPNHLRAAFHRMVENDRNIGVLNGPGGG
jgi:hypothetical protein